MEVFRIIKQRRASAEELIALFDKLLMPGNQESRSEMANQTLRRFRSEMQNQVNYCHYTEAEIRSMIGDNRVMEEGL